MCFVSLGVTADRPGRLRSLSVPLKPDDNMAAEYAVRDMPQYEVYDAIGPDLTQLGYWLGYWCGGLVLSLTLSALVSLATARLVRGRK
jgi:hypothetical protein